MSGRRSGLPEERVRELRVSERDGGSIIVVASPEVTTRIACIVSDLDVVAFADLRELDRWRAGDLQRRDTIRGDVELALQELGCELDRLSPNMRAAVEAICHQPIAPDVISLERQWPSRRSFYRAWAAEIPLAPCAFLRRVRTLAAERLIRCGAAPKEAAIRTGFGSVDRLRRLLRKSPAAAAGGETT